MLVGRLVGAALLALGIACWLVRDDRGSTTRHALLCGMLTYNIGAAILLGIAGSLLQMNGFLLWPAVVLHAGFAAWCWLCLWAAPARR
jgi:hypothetical protein